MFSYFEGLNFLTFSEFSEIFSGRQQRRDAREHFVAFCRRENFKNCVSELIMEYRKVNTWCNSLDYGPVCAMACVVCSTHHHHHHVHEELGVFPVP
jgi:hypothetical protein